jgi:hypothetical protein
LSTPAPSARANNYSHQRTVHKLLPSLPEESTIVTINESWPGFTQGHNNLHGLHVSSWPSHNEYGVAYHPYHGWNGLLSLRSEQHGLSTPRAPKVRPRLSPWWNRMARLMEQFRSLVNDDAYYSEESKECRSRMAEMAARRVKAPGRRAKREEEYEMRRHDSSWEQ